LVVKQIVRYERSGPTLHRILTGEVNHVVEEPA